MEIKDSEWLSMRDDYNGLKRRLVEVIAERDKLRACVKLLADEKHWVRTTADGPTVKAVVFAQKCLEELK